MTIALTSVLTIKLVFPLSPRQSCRRRVSVEFLYGTCLFLPRANAWITLLDQKQNISVTLLRYTVVLHCCVTPFTTVTTIVFLRVIRFTFPLPVGCIILECSGIVCDWTHAGCEKLAISSTLNIRVYIFRRYLEVCCFTYPSSSRDVFKYLASVSRTPSALVFVRRSLPARSQLKQTQTTD